MVTLPQVDRVQGISGAAFLWDTPGVESLLWDEYASTPAGGTYTLTSADGLGLLLLEGVAISGDTQATDTLTLTLGEVAAASSTFASSSVTDTGTLGLTEAASVYIQKFLTAADATGLSLVEAANALLVSREDILTETVTFTLNETATTLITYSEISTGDTLTLTLTEGGSVTVTYVELSSSDIITSVLEEAASREDVTPPVRRLGGTWAQATRPWTGDTKAWGLGVGASRETATLSLGESAQVEVLAVPISVVDAGTLSLTDTAQVLITSTMADAATLSLSDGSVLVVGVQTTDVASLSLTATVALAARASLTDEASLALEETLGDLASSTHTGEAILLSLEELPNIALCVEGHDELAMQLTGRFSLSKVFWPQEGDLPTSDWGEEAKQPSAVWVLQAESLDSGFTKSHNLEKGDIWSKSKPPSPSV